MKKIRMVLPMLAFIFAIAGAVAGDFLPGVNAYYRVNATTCSTVQVTEQSNCDLGTNEPICTILVGAQHKQAFKNSDCSGVLRQIP